MNLISLLHREYILLCRKDILFAEWNTMEHFQGHCTRVQYLTCGLSDAYLCLVQ